MTLNIDLTELLFLLDDAKKYDSCKHNEYDPCCYMCQIKRVIKAWDEQELTVDGDKPESK